MLAVIGMGWLGNAPFIVWFWRDLVERLFGCFHVVSFWRWIAFMRRIGLGFRVLLAVDCFGRLIVLLRD